MRPLKTGDSNSEYAPIGLTTNLASRMQALAPIGSIATTAQVRKLCEGYFELRALAPTAVKGVSEPIDVYEVIGPGPLRTRLQRARSTMSESRRRSSSLKFKKQGSPPASYQTQSKPPINCW